MNRAQSLLGSAIFLVIAPGTVAGLIPWLISGWQMQAPILGFAAFRVIGAVLIAAALPVLLDSFGRFALEGLGTPAPPLPTKHLVVGGLYRHVRNPMYVAVVTAILGQGLLLGNRGVLVYGAAAWTFFHLFVLFYEEPKLRRTFGAEYDAFCARVPRWIPRLRPAAR